MKRIYSILFMLSFVFTMSAQGHLEFMGIPIDGKPKKFISQLEKKGFEHDKTFHYFDNLQRLYGTFGGNLCKLHVLSINREVSKVTVAYLPSTSWTKVYAFYKTLQAEYTLKYVQPESYEVGPNAKSQKFDDVFLNLKNEETAYSSFYQTDRGMIGVRIKSDDGKSGFVEVVYEDKLNFYEQMREDF